MSELSEPEALAPVSPHSQFFTSSPHGPGGGDGARAALRGAHHQRRERRAGGARRRSRAQFRAG